MAIIIDGKATAEKIYEQVKAEVSRFKNRPTLAVIITKDNEAGAVYVRNKKKACEKTGINSITIEFEPTVTEEELLTKIDELNEDIDVDAILVQLPIPNHIDTQKVLNRINPNKDADGFHFINAGQMFTGQMPSTIACTPKGIIRLLDEYKINVAGMNALVIGRSNIVGKPISQLLLQRNATVTVAHSKTKDIKSLAKMADLIVIAIGKPKFLTSDMLKEGVIVIDVGISRVNGKLSGDADFDNIIDKVSYITPVPGGVGPMTVAMLIKNTLELFKQHQKH
jgi:methylenetetrahydrofolate dehydrogenase (NADP+)/methenyltetrahydrofolate cyclohydrolase